MAAGTEAGTFIVTALELKVTVLPEDEPDVVALLKKAKAKPAHRKVYFYDTPGLALCRKDLFLRARITENKEDDSTVKLRPLPETLPAGWTANGDARFEVDVVGDKQVPSAKLDHEPKLGRVAQVEQRTLKPGKLFNKAQEALVETEVPLKDVVMLGPIAARKWVLPAGPFPYELSVEEWQLDDLRFLELSFKVDPNEGEYAKRAFRAFLRSKAIDPAGDPRPKTARVLKKLAQRRS